MGQYVTLSNTILDETLFRNLAGPVMKIDVYLTPTHS